ncbi:MAG: hydrogenase accessory protein HypB [Candidatus Melainabacteria bacterium]|nr:MAG: hydrogenase accessory protein HypB [Candidatus Melainabacteria bacterium]
MCTTCGCSDDADPKVTNLQTGATLRVGTSPSNREHVHEHSHSHLHTHEHTHADGLTHSHEHAHMHEHEHAHSHDHDHTHEHEHAHSHDHAHMHDHEHAHSHDHAHMHDHEHAHSHDHAPSSASSKSASRSVIELERDILNKNNQLAERNRGYFEGRKVLALNLVSSPGSGKTTLLEKLISDLHGKMEISVIEGDQATDADAQRIKATGCKVVQINTGSGCHLESDMIAAALKELDPAFNSIVAIENVGNLVCPALFDLGEACKIAILSVTEGEDKPLKYPHMFRASEVMILNKIDLLPYLKFDVNKCIENAMSINPNIRVFQISASEGAGLDELLSWIEQRAKTMAALS